MLPGLSPDESKKLLLSIGTHRGKRPLSPIEAASLFRKAIAAGSSLSDCANAVQLEGPTWIGRFIKLLDLPPEAFHLVDWGRKRGSITFTAASEVARLPDLEDQQRAIEATLTHDLSSSEVRQLVQLRTRSRKAIDNCVAQVLKMRPQVEVRQMFVGAVTSSKLRDYLRTIPQHQRDDCLVRVCQEQLRHLNISGHLGIERFTLLGGKDFGNFLSRSKNVLEQQINQGLERIADE